MKLQKSLKLLARLAGFEPATHGLEVRKIGVSRGEQNEAIISTSNQLSLMLLCRRGQKKARKIAMIFTYIFT
jgi:hypothetical protein